MPTFKAIVQGGRAIIEDVGEILTAPYTLLSPEEVAAYPATANEQALLDMYTNRAYAGTAETVAHRFEGLQEQTAVDEVMVVLGTHSRSSRSAGERTVKLLAEHYDMPAQP